MAGKVQICNEGKGMYRVLKQDSSRACVGWVQVESDMTFLTDDLGVVQDIRDNKTLKLADIVEFYEARIA